MSDALPLFILCPNGKNDVGLNREKYILNPSCTSSLQLSMYEFVGVLIGIALRTKFTLPLDLPSIFWKQLIGEKNSHFSYPHIIANLEFSHSATNSKCLF